MFVIVSATRKRRDIKIPFVSIGPRTEKGNIVSNKHGSTHKYFSVFDWKYPFRANLVNNNDNNNNNNNNNNKNNNNNNNNNNNRIK